MNKQKIELYRNLSGAMIEGVVLSVFPPLYEDKIANADISINLLLNNGKGYSFDTDSNLWSCTIIEEVLTPNYNYEEFESRMNFWMTDSNAANESLERERFKIKLTDSLGSLIGKTIVKIEFLNINNSSEFNPHGVKLTLNDGQYIISTCGHDGNIIQTPNFLNDVDLIGRFKDIGETKLVELE